MSFRYLDTSVKSDVKANSDKSITDSSLKPFFDVMHVTN